MKRALAFAAATLVPGVASATGFTDIGQDIRAHGETTAEVHGALRLRGEVLNNLDLDRGPTPSGQVLYPVPLSDPNAQSLVVGDLRLRTDLAFYAPGALVAVKVRLDAPDNLTLGGQPEGIPSASITQEPVTVLRIKRAYGEVVTPIGLLAAGRMGSQWGLGMLTNGGDCADCDSGDAADRLAFITPLASHIWAVSFDWSATGPLARRNGGARAIDLDSTDDVRTVTVALLKYRDDRALERRVAAGKSTLDYGAYVSHRWQANDVPADYLPTAQPVAIDASQVMARGYSATALDGWLRLVMPGFRLELEAAALLASVEQASLIPGALLNDPVESRQFGAVLESEVGDPDGDLGGGFDLGVASGDPAPGFGATTGFDTTAPRPGDLDGPQASPPGDARVDNFRFHPDYRVDRILFREIIGTVTDAFYVRPHFRAVLAHLGPGRLEAQLTAIASFAVESTSTPGQKAPLGLEIDPTLSYENEDGFGAALEHAVLFPLAGLDNPALGLEAKPAQLLRLRLIYGF